MVEIKRITVAVKVRHPGVGESIRRDFEHPALVETFEQGECVSYYVDELQGHEKFKSALAHIGTHALLKMLLVDNFIHADMHWEYPCSGMTAELSNNDRIILLEFFKAIARRDGKTVAECTLQMSKKQNCPNPEAFIKEVKESFDFWGTPEGDLVHPAECIEQLLEKGWQRKLDPDYDIMHTLQTLLLKSDWAESLTYTIEGLMAP
ncbi:hypothetical protein HAX54_001308 [Datura stramonium]|uniref:Uncharacterized protein n=1 Tax=Datura stramonium TaxID=4076 RepID=A0ABS8RVS4_DATST|nr:hypothetical protein [Datura stramonium]